MEFIAFFSVFKASLDITHWQVFFSLWFYIWSYISDKKKCELLLLKLFSFQPINLWCCEFLYSIYHLCSVIYGLPLRRARVADIVNMKPKGWLYWRLRCDVSWYICKCWKKSGGTLPCLCPWKVAQYHILGRSEQSLGINSLKLVQLPFHLSCLSKKETTSRWPISQGPLSPKW